ncbi:M17 family metallopeptidase [Legionella sp. W05-934-2]|jgi:leucyl aminopeptidase|uniref:leucyl aminopeptidase family protein n=1 Tax=Legionella sp. W05-934-2 TaxID=1198649 RepID=UPI00346347AF
MTTLPPFFLTNIEDGACVIELIDEADYEQNLAKMTPREQQWLSHHSIAGKVGEVCFIYGDNGQLQKAIMVDKADNRYLSLAKLAKQLPSGHYQLANNLDNEDLLGWGSTQYSFTKYRESKEKLKTLQVTPAQLDWLHDELEAIFLVRDLINTPANDLGPSQLADAVKQLAVQFHAEYEECVGDSLLTHNYPAIHAVGRAAADAPRLASLHWGKKGDPLIAIVGKGVCFDSGGLDIKPAQNMRLMKKDMGGAANAIGLAHWLMRKKLPIRISLYVAAVENAVGAGAFRPGDVITMRNGLTVEVDNTDAEGRLVLADAITRACEDKPQLMINLATLTGAARVAVGTDISAMFCNNEALASAVETASLAVHDPVCRLPLFPGYEKMLDSSIADLVNAPSSFYAGAITAALFLQRFVEKGIPWIHFDVMAWNLSSKPAKPEGGEAMAIRALGQYLKAKHGG